MKRNTLFFGCILGLLPPLIAYLFTSSPWSSINIQPLTIYGIAALVNLLLIRFFYRSECDRSARGVMLITFAAMLLLIINEKTSLT